MGEGGFDQEPQQGLPSHIAPLEEYLLLGSTPLDAEEITEFVDTFNKNPNPRLYRMLQNGYATFSDDLSEEQIKQLNEKRKEPIKGGMGGLNIFDVRAMGGIDGGVLNIVARGGMIDPETRQVPLEWQLGEMKENKFVPLGKDRPIVIADKFKNVFGVEGNKVFIPQPQPRPRPAA